jgi:lysophospholipid acyltransferase (LPLAT)-like uncharacterized protein
MQFPQDVETTLDMIKGHLAKIEDGIERDEFGETIAMLVSECVDNVMLAAMIAQGIDPEQLNDELLKEFGWQIIDGTTTPSRHLRSV